MFQLLLVIIYLAFISLGLPDALLGSAWPSMYRELGASVSYAGIISMIIAGGTIISSLFSDRLIRNFGTGKVTVVSVAMTAAALFGFSSSHCCCFHCCFSSLHLLSSKYLLFQNRICHFFSPALHLHTIQIYLQRGYYC